MTRISGLIGRVFRRGKKVFREILRLGVEDPWGESYPRERALFSYTGWDRYWLDINRPQHTPTLEDLDVMEFDLLRFVHAIDKGLQLPNRKVAFGREKIRCILTMLRHLICFKNCREQVIAWAVEVLRQYVEVLRNDLETKEYSPTDRSELVSWLNELERELDSLLSMGELKIESPESNGLSNVYYQRRSIRQWSKKPVEDAILRQIVEAAVWAPSSCNRQPYKFIFIRSEHGKRLLLDVATGGRGLAEHAPVIVLLLSDVRAYYAPSERHLAYIDSALASQNLSLAAHELGLGTVWLNCATEDFVKEDRLRNELSIPPWYAIVGALAIGYPREGFQAKPPVRRCVDNIILHERFGSLR